MADDAPQRTGDAPDRADGDEVLLELPERLRSAFKDPFGPLYTDTEALLAEAGEPLVAVGDIVTYHFEAAGRRPDVAVVDGRTKRRAVEDEVRETVDTESDRIRVGNPPGTLTGGLLDALVAAIDADDPVTILVDGEEDLAAVPAVLAAPEGATVVYGQPDEGMVAVAVTPDRKREFRELLAEMDGDVDRALELLE